MRLLDRGLFVRCVIMWSMCRALIIVNKRGVFCFLSCLIMSNPHLHVEVHVSVFIEARWLVGFGVDHFDTALDKSLLGLAYFKPEPLDLG